MHQPDTPEISTAKPSRRTVLRAGSGGALALLLGGAAGIVDRRNSDGGQDPASATPHGGSSSASSSLSEIGKFGEVDPAIVALGERVVASEQFTDPAALIADLGLTDGVDGDVLAHAAQMVRTDFSERRTLMIDGWILAESEAKAAAVLALVCREQATC